MGFLPPDFEPHYQAPASTPVGEVDSPADIIAQLLVELRQGVAVDQLNWASQVWPVFVSKEPNQPDNAITVQNTQGTDHGRLAYDGSLQQHFGIQIMVRCRDNPTGWRKTNDVRNTLAQSVYREVVTMPDSGLSYLVHAVARIGQVLDLGWDGSTSKRHLFTVNMQTAIDLQ